LKFHPSAFLLELASKKIRGSVARMDNNNQKAEIELTWGGRYLFTVPAFLSLGG
jgi:hypothetical protein